MQDELNFSLIKKSITTEINEGFPHFSFFTIPLDLSFNIIDSLETNSLDSNIDLTDDNELNNLYNNLMNTSFISYDEDYFSGLQEISKSDISQNDNQTKKSWKSISIINPFNKSNEENDSLNNFNCISEKEKEGKKENNIKKLKNCINLNKCNDYFLQNIQNYSINIYNPHYNCVNIAYSSFSPNPHISFSNNNNQENNEKFNNVNEKGIINEKIPFNLCCEDTEYLNKEMNNTSLNRINNNMNILINNSYNYLGNNFLNNKQNSTNSNLNSNQNLKKPKKKKKKKTIDDDYTIEMFGRRGWICEGCNNFNYESRKNCNRCKIPKKPLKRGVILDNKGKRNLNNLMNEMNFNHKDDWNCYNCGNINYAFRLNCNRCQMKRDIAERNNN